MRSRASFNKINTIESNVWKTNFNALASDVLLGINKDATKFQIKG